MDGLSQKLKEVQRELDEVSKRLAVHIPDFYGQFYRQNQDHPEHQRLFYLSVEFLRQEALRRKDEVIASLEMYADVLRNRADRKDPDAWRKMKGHLAGCLRDVTLIFPVITCALPSVRNMMPFLSEGCVDRIIVDEAGMIPLHQLFPLLVRGKRAIVVGDPLQIEPVINMAPDQLQQYREEAFEGAGLSEDDFTRYSPTATYSATAYHRAAGAGDNDIGNGIVLKEHRRCQAPIAEFFNALCRYDFTIQTGEKNSPLGTHLIAYHVEGTLKNQVNIDELEAVETIVGHLVEKGFRIRGLNGKDDDTIGVISPFRAHADALRRRLETRWADFKGQDAIGTVHKFQGGEKSAIVFSTRISQAGEKGIGFLNGRPNLLNVAVSRAKDVFILVGNLHRLKNGGGYAAKLVEHIERHGVVLEYRPTREVEAIPRLPAFHTVRDCDHINELQQALDAAREELVLVCPWIRGQAAAVFADQVKTTLERGVAVTVVYGYRHDHDQDAVMVRRLQDLFAAYPNARLHRLQDGTHEKYLICDSAYAVIGSWNWLSHWYGPACRRQQLNPLVQVRHETSLRITDPETVHQLKQGVIQRLEREGVPPANQPPASTGNESTP